MPLYVWRKRFLHMLLPYTPPTGPFTPGYNEYQLRRGNNKLLPTEMLKLNYNTALPEFSSVGSRLNGWEYAVHHKMPNWQALFNGTFPGLTLATPLSSQRWLAIHPPPSQRGIAYRFQFTGWTYSHSDQIAAWQTVLPQFSRESAGGMGGTDGRVGVAFASRRQQLHLSQHFDGR